MNYILYCIDIYLYNAIGNIGNQTLLKESGFGWFVPFCVCYMTSWHYLERKNPTKHLYHDYKRNGLRLLWLLCFHWMQNFLCPVSVPKSKKLLFGGLMWALLGGKDLQSELPPSISCLMLQWNCQLEITVPTFQALFQLLPASFQLLSFRKHTAHSSIFFLSFICVGYLTLLLHLL